MVSDATLQQNVIDELAWRPDVDSAHIGVVAANRVVTLTGYVSTFAEKVAAIDAAEHVAGVRGVKESLEVRLPEEVAVSSDDEIAARALSSLAWDTLIPSNSVNVEVEDGWVTLSGDVAWQFQRNEAERAVRKLPGVVGVTNGIRLKQQPQPSDLKMRIQNALSRRADLDSKSIRVSVTGGTVTLDGTVDSWTARDLAEGAAWAAPGVLEVRDNLQVSM